MAKSYEEILKEQQEKVNKLTYTPVEERNTVDSNLIQRITTPEVVAKYQNNSKKWYEEWLNAGAFKDGYQFGDFTKTALSTVGDVGLNLTKGVVKAGESIGDLAAYGGAQIVDWLGNKDYADQVRQHAAEDLTGKIFSGLDNLVDKNSISGEKLDNVINSVGNMYAQSKVSSALFGDKANLTLNLGGKKFNLPKTSIISGASSGMSDAVSKNAENWQVWLSGLSGGLSEGISESLFGTFGIGGSDLDDVLINSITKNMKNGLAKTLTKAGIKATGEGVEEVASYLLDYGSKHGIDFIKNNFNLKGTNLGEEFSKEELWENFFSGTLAAGLGGLPSTINTIKGKQSSFDLLKSSNEQNKVHLPLPQSNNTNLNKLQGNEQNKFQFMPVENTKVNNLRKSASNYFSNTQESHNFVNTFAKIIEDKNYNITFDNTISSNTENMVNAKISTLENGEVDIRINPNSQRAGEFLIMHEVTHAIETDSMKKLILDHASKNSEFNESLTSLKETYGTNDVSSEVITDISGQLFGNQEFINNLSMEQPSIFKRIYNAIISMANKITGNSRESLFIKDLRNKWETAYRTQNNNLNNTEYMMTGLKGTKNAIKNDSNNQFLMDNYNKANQMIKKGLENETIRQKTGWFQDSKDDWKFEISDHEAKITSKLEKNKTYKLGDILEHNDLYEMYPELKDTKIVFKNIKDGYDKIKEKFYPIAGYYFPLTKTISINNMLIDTHNFKEIENTILHEIQHRIQKKEGFDYGYKGNDIEGYKRNLGEREAKDTERRKKLNYEERLMLPPKSMIDSNNNVNYSKNGGNNHANNKLYKKILPPTETTNERSINDTRRNGADVTRQELENSSFSLTNSQGKKIDISNLQETSYMKQFTFNRKYNRDNITTYRGVGEEGGTGVAFYGLGLYTTLDKNYAKQYGDVSVVDSSLLPNNPLHFKTQNDFKIWEQEIAKQLDLKKNELYGDYGVEQYVKKLGYDGLMIGTGKDTDLISFTESAIKYSKNSDKWQEHLEKNYKATGTRTNMQDIKQSTVKLPLSKETKVKLPTKTDIEKIGNKRLISEHEEEKIKKKVQKTIEKRSRNAILEAVNIGDKYLDFDKRERQHFKDILTNLYQNKTSEDLDVAYYMNEIKELVQEFSNKEIDYIDTELKEVKDDIRKYKIKLSDEVKRQITDFTEFRKANFNKLNITNKGRNIDSVYMELCETYPHYFDSSITNEVDMAYALEEFVNQDIHLVEKYKIDDESVELATSRIFNKIVNGSMSETEIKVLEDELIASKKERTREVVRKELLDEMGINESDLLQGEDINSIQYQRTDPIRLNEKVFGHETGSKINEATINKTKHNEAERTRFLNQEREFIKELGIKPRSEESAAVQKYAEKQYVGDTGKYIPYTDKELAIDFPKFEDQQKIIHASEMIRSLYDKYLEQINEVITDMGYDPIKKRKDYIHHFQEIETKLSKWGLPLTNLKENMLPTDINGLTDLNKPGKQWFNAALKREGVRTTYDAIAGIDKYLETASNLIYHTEDIQRYRALSKMIRDTYGREKGFDGIEALDEENYNKRVQDIFRNKLSGYAAWLDEQANSLAGKKGMLDRSAERIIGRKIYSVLEDAKKQVGSNMTGFNIRSSITNFASVIQGASKTKKKAVIKGLLSTMRNIVKDDGLINKSDFLTSRFGSDSLAPKLWQKISQAGQILMNASDTFSSNLIWRSKYYENLGKGMSEKNAIKNADDFSARILGDRSKGSTAEIFNSKTLGFFTQFQLEVNNQWSSLIHDNKMDVQSGKATSKGVLFQLGQLAAMSYVFNFLTKELTGSSVMLDPIDMLMKIFKGDDDDEEKDILSRSYEVMADIADQLPFGNIITGSSNGRLPISEAFSVVSSARKKLFNQKDEYGNEIGLDSIGKDAITSLGYWLLPTGFGQIKKTYKGLSMYDKKLPVPGSYTKSGNLRFKADETPFGILKAALFGQYSSKESQDYIESGYKTVRKENIEEMQQLNMSSSEYKKYRTGLAASGKKTSEKIDYIYNQDNFSLEQKNIMAENLYTKDTDSSREELETIKLLKMSDSQKKSYYELKSSVSVINSSKEKTASEKHQEIAEKIINSNHNDKQAAYLYSKYYSSEEVLNNLITMKIPIKEFIKLNSQNIESDYNENTGKTISNSARNKYIKAVNELKLNVAQKAILIKSKYNSYKEYDTQIVNYVNQLKATVNDKKVLLKSIGFNNYNQDVIEYINSQNITKTEKEKKLKSLGFTIRNGKVYS